MMLALGILSDLLLNSGVPMERKQRKNKRPRVRGEEGAAKAKKKSVAQEEPSSDDHEQTPSTCASDGCDRPGAMACPSCQKLGTETLFCNQQCFTRSWATHKRAHKTLEDAPKQQPPTEVSLDEQIRMLEASLDSDGDDSSSCSSSEDEDDQLTGPHGEMAVSRAQRTAAVRVESCFTLSEVSQLLEAHKQLKDQCGLVTKKHGEASSNWNTTFLQTDGLFASELPKLRQRILDTAAAVDAEQQWGLLSSCATDTYALRVVELHTVGPGGSLPERKHYDEGSLVTIDVMLSPQEDFDGGQLQTLETDGEMHDAVFSQGDATVFVSHKYHSVTPVTRGKRQVRAALFNAYRALFPFCYWLCAALCLPVMCAAAISVRIAAARCQLCPFYNALLSGVGL